MEKQIAEIMSSVDDVRKTQASIINRVEILKPSVDQQNCHCNHDTEQLQKDISRLRGKWDVLERIDKEHNQKLFILSEEAKGLQNRLDSIESLLLSKQMDDSKLQRFSSKTNTIFLTESTTASSETKLCSAEVLRSYTEQTRKKSVDDIGVMGFKEGSDNADITKDLKPKPAGLDLKPNFLKKEKTEVKQAERLVLDGDRYLRSIAQNELDRGRAQFSRLEGVHSVICLDISDSMSEGNAWSQAKTFLTDYLRGLDDMSKLPNLNTEYVALVTFGNETKIQSHFTDRYSDVQKIIDNLKLGGPSQMYGGILFAHAAGWSSSHKIDQLKNGALVFTKIIMITDGRPTEVDLIAGPDMVDNSKLDETKATILQEMERSQNNNEEFFFVPVGISDMDYLETMTAVSNGIMLTYKSGRRLARRQYLSAQLIDPLGLHADTLTYGSDNKLSSEDKDDMRCVQDRARRCVVKSGRYDVYAEISDTSLPPPGTRVRRGPDWQYGPQDSFGPGTIIGHCTEGPMVWVEWDAQGRTYPYSYGINGYDVLIVDEPRVLQAGQKMDVGCEVKRSKDWRDSEHVFERGIVLKIDRLNNKAMVRWSNGMRGDYSYGYGGPKEIELLLTSQSASQCEYGGSSYDGFQITSLNGSLNGFQSEPLGGYMSSNITSVSVSVNRKTDYTESHLMFTQDEGRSRKSAVRDDISKKPENMSVKRNKNKNKK